MYACWQNTHTHSYTISIRTVWWNICKSGLVSLLFFIYAARSRYCLQYLYMQIYTISLFEKDSMGTGEMRSTNKCGAASLRLIKTVKSRFNGLAREIYFNDITFVVKLRERIRISVMVRVDALINTGVSFSSFGGKSNFYLFNLKILNIFVFNIFPSRLK